MMMAVVVRSVVIALGMAAPLMMMASEASPSAASGSSRMAGAGASFVAPRIRLPRPARPMSPPIRSSWAWLSSPSSPPSLPVCGGHGGNSEDHFGVAAVASSTSLSACPPRHDSRHHVEGVNNHAAADDEAADEGVLADMDIDGPGAAGGDDDRRSFLLSCTSASLLLLLGTSSAEVEPAGATTFAVAGGGGPASPPSSNVIAGTTTTTASTIANATQPIPVDARAILDKATKRAVSGGKAGASAAVVQVLALMWLRTAMNYQYRYGGTLQTSLSTLYSEGGIPRLYQGLPFALVQGPLTRFGDTAANVGILALLDGFEATAGLPLPLRTLAGSVSAGLWRIFLMPVDTSKTVLQVEGADGLNRLRAQVAEGGPGPLYQGALASAAATAAGHFPWFATYNFLNEAIPTVAAEEGILPNLVRSAFLGLCSSCVSDCCSNSLRVIKTTKQTAGFRRPEYDAAATGELKANATDAVEVADGRVGRGVTGGGEAAPATPTVKAEEGGARADATHAATNAEAGEKEGAGEVSYREALSMVLEKDGVGGLFGRGLKTRLLTNAIQGAAFSVLWKYFQTVGSIGGGRG